MTTLLLLLLIVVVIVGIVLILRNRAGKKTTPAARVDPLADYPEVYDPYKIGVGDIITYAGIDHVVRGTITLDEEGYIWHEHLLDGSTGQRWLTVENDEGNLDMTLWMRREGTGLEPDGDVILDDRVHRQIERGTASFTAEGTTGTAPQASSTTPTTRLPTRPACCPSSAGRGRSRGRSPRAAPSRAVNSP